MQIEVASAKESEQPILANLWELYCYDFSEILSSDVGRDGRFGDRRGFERHWTDPRRHPFIIRVDGRLAGFVLVRRHSDLTGDDAVADMAEFFVMRKYRKLGVGERAAG